MQRFFISSTIINGVLSILFLVLAVYAVVSQKNLSPEEVVFLVILLFSYSVFLVQSFLCWQLVKRNQQLTTIKRSIIVLAKIISIIAFLLGVILIIAAVGSVIDFEMYATKQQLPNSAGFILSAIIVSISGITAIINCICYFKIIKQNKLIVNSVINTIGDGSSV